MDRIEAFADPLLSWFHQNKRAFSWRETNDPFAVLIAEILLRKTDAPKVQAVFTAFLEKYPSAEKLAQASLKELRTYLRPLGMYYVKSKQLKLLAQQLVSEHNGRVPLSRDDLLKLPGVGNYIANAVLCYSGGFDFVALDTNGLRVLLRFFGLRSQKARPRTDKNLWQLAQNMIPRGRARDFNLALLDFAAKVCRLRDPSCAACPLSDTCKWPRRKEYMRLCAINKTGTPELGRL